jgi:hypothetical protein
MIVSRCGLLLAGSVLFIAGCTSSHGNAAPSSSAVVSSADGSIAASGGVSSAAPASAVAPASSVVAPASSAASPSVTGTSEATPGGPAITLSATHGAAGTTVTVTITGCPEPAKGYVGFFADAHALATPDDPTLRHALSFQVPSTDSTTAKYTVNSGNAVGAGIFEVQCGTNANATAAFTVDS